MTLFDELLRRVDAWLDRIDRERDEAMRTIGRQGSTPELQAWLDRLDGERAKHGALMAVLDDLRLANHPALLLPERPTRMLKASLQRPAAARKEA